MSQWKVHYYDPKRRGTWIAKFDTAADAARFAEGKTVWGRPAKAVEIQPIDQVAVDNFLASLDGLSITDAFANARADGKSYGWNYETQAAVAEGISKHFERKAVAS